MSPEGCLCCRPRSSSCGRPARTGGSACKPLERTGGVRGAVSRLAETSYEQLSPPSRRRAGACSSALWHPARGNDHASTGRARRVRPHTRPGRGGRADAVHGRPPAHENRGHGGGGHEALLREWPRLRVWLEEDLQGHQLRQHLTHAAGNGRRRPRRLGGVPGARLSAAGLGGDAGAGPQRGGTRLPLGESAGERARQKQRRTNRRLRGLLVGTAVFLLVALLAGGLALVQRGRARDEAVRAENQARIATARELAAAAVANLEVDPERSILLALEALDATGKADGRACARGRGGPPSGAAGVPGLAQGGARRRDRHKRRRQEFATTGEDGTPTVWETDTDGSPHAPRTRGARSRHRLQPRRDAAGHRWPRPDSAAVGRGERPAGPRSARASAGSWAPPSAPMGRCSPPPAATAPFGSGTSRQARSNS